MRNDYSDAYQSRPRHVELRYTKFRINGIPGEKHAVFIPDGLKLSRPVFSQICGALHKEMPSMLLAGMSSLRHPARMSTKQLRECEGFKPLMDDAMSSLGMIPNPSEERGFFSSACSRDSGADYFRSELRLNDEDPTRDSLDDVANRVLEKKIGSMVCAAASAAQRANAWIFSGPQISAFEVFLQQGIEADEIDVFRLVAAHVQDRAYMESAQSVKLLQQLCEKSQPMSVQAVYRADPLTLKGDLWNPTRNASHPEFAKYGYDQWSFDTYEDTMAEGHPITQWPWPYGDLFLFFYREEVGLRDVDWSYATRVRHDLEAIPFDPELLAPVAYVCIGGNEPNAKKKLMQALKVMSPLVVMDNTPSVPKQMALLLNLVARVWQPSPLSACRPFLAEGTRLWGSPSNSELLQALSPSKLLNHVERAFDNSGMQESERLALSDVVGLLDIVKRRPQAFRETVCVVDPLRNSPETVTTQITALLSSPQSREMNNPEIHRSLVMKAWRLHRKLARKARQLRDFATALAMAIAIAMLLTTVLAVLAVFLCLQKAGYEDVTFHVSAFLMHKKLAVSYTWSEAAWVLHLCLLTLPVAAALLAALQAHFRVSQKWSSVHMVASQVVSEIYRFLGCLGGYSTVPALAQQIFMKRLQDMVKQLSASGIQEDELMQGGDAEEEGFPRDAQALEEHIDEHLYGVSPPGCCRRRLQQCSASLGSAKPPKARDPTAQLSAETYMEVRILPLRRHYRDLIRSVARLRTTLNVCFVLNLCAASGLGASGLYVWVPVPLGLAAFLLALTQWMAPPEMLLGVTNALTALNSMHLKWFGSDIRENRSDASKLRLISTTEKIARVIAMILTGSNAPPEEGAEEEDYWSGDGDTSTPSLSAKGMHETFVNPSSSSSTMDPSW